MSKVRILIVEDELLVATEMADALENQGYEVVEMVDNAQDAKRALEIYQVDIILIDIKLRGEEDGISVATFIRLNYSLPLIFITSLVDRETISRALQAKPSAYLVKPYNNHELHIAIEMALYNFERKNTAELDQKVTGDSTHYFLNQHVFVKDGHKFVRIDYEDVLWMKAESSYVSIVTTGETFLLTTDTLGSMLEKINCEWMVRIHRSYAVNIRQVKVIEGNQLLINDRKLPIGKNYRTSIKHHFHFIN